MTSYLIPDKAEADIRSAEGVKMKRPVLLALLVCFVHGGVSYESVSQVTVLAADHGAVPDDDGDDTAALRAAIHAAASAGGPGDTGGNGVLPGDSVFNLDRCGAGYIIRGNTFAAHRGRCIVLRATEQGTVSGNRAAIHLGNVDHAVVQGNHVEGCGMPMAADWWEKLDTDMGP